MNKARTEGALRMLAGATALVVCALQWTGVRADEPVHHLYLHAESGGELLVLNVPGAAGAVVALTEAEVTYLKAAAYRAGWSAPQAAELDRLGGDGQICSMTIFAKVNPQPGEPVYKCADSPSNCYVNCWMVQGGVGSITLDLAAH